MSEADFAKYTRLQKLALFLIVIGPEAAAEVLRHFEDGEIETLCREMGQISSVPADMRDMVFAEFAPIIGQSLNATLGGLGYARKALELARGDHKASLLLSRVDVKAPVTSSAVLADIAEMEGRQIANLLKEEQPQTVAFLLSHLTAAKAAEVFQLLSPDQRDEVVERLGTIDSTPRDLVSKIVRNLRRHTAGQNALSYQPSGGVRAVADLLNNLDKESSKNLLTRIEERNAALGEAVRRKLFSFEDIKRLAAADLQRVLREVDSAHLATAMKSASEALRERVFASLSKRAAEALADEISMLGPVRVKDVETAQDAIIQVVRRMEEEGSIVLGDGEGAMVA
jgi:flagellar motor switch protein FliG